MNLSNPARTLVVLASLALIAGLFVALSGGGDDDAGDEAALERAAPSAPGTPPTTEPEPEPEIPTIRVVGGEPEGGVETLSYSRGELVRFEVVSDTADELHVHGYDIMAGLEPGEPATVRFDAEIDGIFEVEVHSTHSQIARLRIDP